jgi:hypothetical protein
MEDTVQSLCTPVSFWLSVELEQALGRQDIGQSEGQVQVTHIDQQLSL